MFCKNCGTKMKDNEMFCPNCGTKQDAAPVNNPQAPLKKEKKKLKINKKIAAAIAVVLTVVLIVSFVVVPVANKIMHPAKKGFVTYLKDNEIYINYLDEFGSQQLTKKLLLDDFDDNGYFNANYYAELGIKYYPELKRIFFPDRIEKFDSDIDYDARGLSLYYVDLNKKDEIIDAVKVDSSMMLGYKISDDGKKVYYQNTKRDLFVSDLQTSTKLAENVESYFINEDKNTIIYDTYSSDTDKYDLYSLVPGDTAKKIAAGIDNVEFLSDDGSAVCFDANRKLYVSINGETPKEIVSYDEDSWISACYADNAGHVVFTQKGSDLLTKNFVEDDMAADDDKMEYPSWFDDDYGEKIDKYNEKEERDEIRDYLTDDTLKNLYDLYYYDGSKTEKIAENVSDSVLLDDGFVVFNCYDINAKEKVKFSEIYNNLSEKSIYYFRQYVADKVLGDIKANILIEKTVNRIEQPIYFENYHYGDYILNNDKSELYYIAEQDEGLQGLSGNLYKASINGTKLGEAKKLCDDVSTFYFDNSGRLITFRDPIETDDGIYSADLYIDDKKIDTDVTVHYSSTDGYRSAPLSMYSEDGTIFYTTSYTQNGSGTLKQYDGKTSTIIASDVIDYYAVEKDFVYYINSYNANSAGELYVKKGEETIEIASGVSAVFKAIENTNK